MCAIMNFVKNHPAHKAKYTHEFVVQNVKNKQGIADKMNKKKKA